MAAPPIHAAPGDRATSCPSWLRTDLARARARGLVLPPPAVWEDPAVRAVFPFAAAERFARNWADQALFLDVLDRLPRTLCHRDAFRNNLMARRAGDGRVQTVAIDWALAGPGHLGEDLYKFVTNTQLALRTEAGPRELDGVAFENYLAGLRDVGWNGDPRIARLGYTATVVMFAVAWPGLVVGVLRDHAFAAQVAWINDKPAEELRSRWIEVAYHQLALADEARRLTADLDVGHPVN